MEENPASKITPPETGFTNPIQQSLPNSTAVLVLGILSIVFICPYISLISIVIGIIALVLASRDQNLYNSNPAIYSYSSYNNLKAGRVCAIIGLSIAIFTFIIGILFIIGIIATSTFPFWGMTD